MPAGMFGLFTIVFVGIALMWLVKPRTMIRWNQKWSNGGTRIEPSDTQILLTRIVALLILLLGSSFLF